jgi:hypothetical protein
MLGLREIIQTKGRTMGFSTYDGEIPTGKGGRTESAEMATLKAELTRSLVDGKAGHWDGDGLPTKTALGRVRRAATQLDYSVKVGQLDSGAIVFRAFAKPAADGAETETPAKPAKRAKGSKSPE